MYIQILSIPVGCHEPELWGDSNFGELSTAVFRVDGWVLFTIMLLLLDSSFHCREITGFSINLQLMILLYWYSHISEQIVAYELKHFFFFHYYCQDHLSLH